MRDHNNDKRAYIRSSKAWYSKALKEESISVSVGMYHPNGGTSGEFQFEWVPLGDKLFAELKACDDGWSALWQFKDLLEKMAEIDDQEIQEQEFCELLDSLGIIDITEYERGVPKNKL